MELIYELEGAGWVSARISEGSRQCELSVSYLSDALGDMAQAAVMLLIGSREETFRFQDEPGEHRFILTRGDADALTVRVLWFEDTFSSRADEFGKEVFRCECPALEFVGQVYSNLHAIVTKHGLDGYQRAWRYHEFPSEAYDAIRERLAV